MSAGASRETTQLELRPDGKLLPGIVHFFVAAAAVSVLAVGFFIIVQPGILVWLLVIPPIFAVAMLAGPFFGRFG